MCGPAQVERALALAGDVAAELVTAGASAVVLMGSFARGTATPASDIDIYAIGEGLHYRLERWEPFLVSISWRTEASIQSGFLDPAEAFGLIPGWQRPIILADPDGIAARLQAQARRWTVNTLDQAACDRWVADQVTGFAEEVHKLAGYRELGKTTMLAVNRSILALRLAVPLAVHRRLLYETENELWDLMNGVMGDRWSNAQARALGMGGETLDETVHAAGELFALACQEVVGLLDARQRAVVEHACRIAGFPLNQSEERQV